MKNGSYFLCRNIIIQHLDGEQSIVLLLFSS